MLSESERRPIFDGAFEVTADGRIYRVVLPNGRVVRRELTTHLSRGYLRVGLCMGGGKRVRRGVHQLVALAFYGPPAAGMDTAHLNGIRTDNRIENLKYVTRKENHSHMEMHGTSQRGEGSPNAKLTNEAVLHIREAVKRGVKCTVLAERYGVSRHAVQKASAGKSWKYVESLPATSSEVDQ